jgi:outer membrane lipase/esterase
VLLVDVNSLLRSARNNPARFGAKEGLKPACDIPKLPQRSVVFCDQATLVEKDAHLTHIYADGVHPSTAGHRIIAEYVLEQMKTR